MADELREVAMAAIQATRKPNEIPIYQRQHIDAVADAMRPLLEKRDSEIAELKLYLGRCRAQFAVTAGQSDRYKAALEKLSASSPPDDWNYYVGAGDYCGHGKRGNPDYMDEPDTSNYDDMFAFGAAVGRWQSAKIARQALAGDKEQSSAS